MAPVSLRHCLKPVQENMRTTPLMKTMLAIFTLHTVIITGHCTAIARTPEQNTYAHFMQMGSEQMKAGDYRAARDTFEQALKYNDSSYAAHLGLGVAYFLLRDDNYAERELLNAADIDPSIATAYQYLGELYYRKDDLETAEMYWDKALSANPSAADIRARLDRIRKERTAEKNFNRDVSSHFLIKFEGREKIEAGRIVTRILEDAYGELGRALSFYPDREIQVILYSEQQFQNVTDAPGWSGGVYDGKIRIPVGGIEQETPGLKKLLYHEYTHAVVRAITPTCPTWLNEGLAQYFEGRQIDTRQRLSLKQLAQAGNVPSLKNLEGSFMGLGGSQAQYAYLFSLSSVSFMIDSFGMYRVRGVLDELAKGVDINRSLSNGVQVTYEDFERRWKQSLE
jgi:tetratricopeptide (TPR) repeat protein